MKQHISVLLMVIAMHSIYADACVSCSDQFLYLYDRSDVVFIGIPIAVSEEQFITDLGYGLDQYTFIVIASYKGIDTTVSLINVVCEDYNYYGFALNYPYLVYADQDTGRFSMIHTGVCRYKSIYFDSKAYNEICRLPQPNFHKRPNSWLLSGVLKVDQRIGKASYQEHSYLQLYIKYNESHLNEKVLTDQNQWMFMIIVGLIFALALSFFFRQF
ncbi:MAG: hypothetical protein H6546_07795 [Chitinophagales bacterium]|nr:hypothetical protein [Chitinophagales bacterium]